MCQKILALKWPYMTLDDLWGHNSFYEKFVSSNDEISWKVFKRSEVKQIMYCTKRWFRFLRWPYLTLYDLWGHTVGEIFNVTTIKQKK